jgi:hypothetical protein
MSSAMKPEIFSGIHRNARIVALRFDKYLRLLTLESEEMASGIIALFIVIFAAVFIYRKRG